MAARILPTTNSSAKLVSLTRNEQAFSSVIPFTRHRTHLHKMFRRKSLASIPLTCEKETQFDLALPDEQPRFSLHASRRNPILALCGIIILITGVTAIATSMFCTKTLPGDYRLNSIHARGLVGGIIGDNVNSLNGVAVTATAASAVTATASIPRPNKFFGPTILPAVAALLKQKTGMLSIEKRDDEALETIEERDIIDKRASVWQPAPGLTWTYQLSQVPSSDQLKNAAQYNVWDIDLFDTPVDSIKTIQAAGSKVICYFSGGTMEGWRSDANKFQPGDVGAPMGSWPNENWINTRSSNVRKIMTARLDLAQSKGCNGVDPDNIDAYNHQTGFPLTQNDAVNYVTYLAKQAAQRGLAISLKNSGDIIPRVLNVVQYSVEEACSAYSECDLYKPFTDAGKAVFHVEYPKGYGTVNTATVASSSMAAICTCKPKAHLSPIVKNNNLDSWQQECP